MEFFTTREKINELFEGIKGFSKLPLSILIDIRELFEPIVKGFVVKVYFNYFFVSEEIKEWFFTTTIFLHYYPIYRSALEELDLKQLFKLGYNLSKYPFGHVDIGMYRHLISIFSSKLSQNISIEYEFRNDTYEELFMYFLNFITLIRFNTNDQSMRNLCVTCLNNMDRFAKRCMYTRFRKTP